MPGNTLTILPASIYDAEIENRHNWDRYLREAIPVARDTIRAMSLARLALHRAIARLDQYFSAKSTNW